MVAPVTRKAEVFNEHNGTWVEKPFEELKLKDVYRLYEEDGTLVLNANGSSINIVLKEPEIIDGVWALEDEQYVKYYHPDIKGE